MCLWCLQGAARAVGAPTHGCGVLQLADGREVAAQAVVVNADPFRLRELAGAVNHVEHGLVLGHAALPPTQRGCAVTQVVIGGSAKSVHGTPCDLCV